MLYYYAECYYAECRDLFIIMLNLIMLNLIMLNVVMLSVIMLSVVVPLQPSLMFARKVAYTKEVPFTRYTLRYAPDLTSKH
jgi:hypothetical protein